MCCNVYGDLRRPKTPPWHLFLDHSVASVKSSTIMDSLCIVYRKFMPMPNCKPFRPSSPFRNTKGREKFNSNLAAGCA